MQVSVAPLPSVAARLGVSHAAVELARAAEVVDLHLDSLIPQRLFGYDPLSAHPSGRFGGRFFAHADVPRLDDGGVKAAMWSITTNPWRSREGRLQALRTNVAALKQLVACSSGRLALAGTMAEYEEARRKGSHVVLLAIQGANALASPGDVPELAHLLVRVTLVHLTNSHYGASSSPLGALRRHKGLTPHGRELVAALNASRVFVDLAHIHRQGFWEAVEAQAKDQPLIVTHTGVAGVTPHWRNLDDAQLKAIAESGGTVGIFYQASFMRRAGSEGAEMVLAHMQHAIDVIGEDHVSLGTDFDGAIVPPKGLESADTLPRLVQAMLDAGYTETRIRKILGQNFLRCFAQLRP